MWNVSTLAGQEAFWGGHGPVNHSRDRHYFIGIIFANILIEKSSAICQTSHNSLGQFTPPNCPFFHK
jgi:hypothetical protein